MLFWSGVILSPYGVGTWAWLVLALALGGLVSGMFFWPAGVVFGAGLLFVLNFFRDPERTPEGGEGGETLISPADGKVVEISEVTEAEHVGGAAVKVAIFMNVFDVHVNRAPCACRVEWVRRVAGGFVNAIRARAGLENERALVALRDWRGRPVLVKLIAGLIARRIVCAVGMIKFGSRVEVFVPRAAEFAVRVRLGERVLAGRTVLGEWR